METIGSKIYTVCTLKDNDPASGSMHGFFFDKETASRVIEDNLGDVFEHYYDYAVIEEYTPGLYRMPSEVQWYKLCGYKDGEAIVEKCERPSCFNHYCNFSFG